MPLIIAKPYKQVAVACAYLDNTFWTNGNDMFWTGTEWTSQGFSTQWRLDVTGTWAAGFRPSQIDITFFRDSSGIDTNVTKFRLRDTANAPLTIEYDLESFPLDTEFTINAPITFGANDIGDMAGDNFMYNGGLKIRCIEFS